MILLTGGLGFIGGHVQKVLDEFAVYDIKMHPNFDIFKLTEDDVAQYDAVIHLAAISSVPLSMQQPYETYRTNILGTQHILDCKPKKLIFASSGSVVDPISPYALSKQVCEQLIGLSDVPSCILRLGNVYGEGDDKSAIMHFLQEPTIKLTGDGSQRRSFVYAGDVARAFKRALKLTGTYNIGHQLFSIATVAGMLNKPIEYVPGRPGETHTYDILFDGMPGWKPKTTLYEWMNSNKS